MEPNFEQLLSSKIKRLGKSTVMLDEPTLCSSYSVGSSSSEVILTSSSHTQHMDAVKVGDKNYYLSEFGKVYTGEVFRGLIIMSNKSPHHALTDLELTICSTCQNKGQTKTLLKKSIPKIDKASANSQIIEFRAEFTDTYVIEIKARYKSDYFKDIVRKMDIDNMSPSQRNKLQNMESYRIDYANRDVTRNFSKKFKFQTRSPFQLEHSIVLRQNKYFMEIIIESDTTLLFLQSVAFNVNNLELDVLDLNPHEEEMVGSVMKKKEKRSFIFAIFPKNEHIKIKKTDKTGIGTVSLKWQNTFGDIGDIVFGPFIYMGESDKDADAKAEDLSKQLVLDEPVWVKVSPLETIKQKGKVELDIDADNIEGISIHSLP